MEERLTPDEWLARAEFAGLVVFDPDGWNRAPGQFEASWAEPLTRDEFINRVARSTCQIPVRMMREWAAEE